MHDKRASLIDVIRLTYTTHMQSVVDQTSNSTTIVGMQIGLIDAGYRLELNTVIVNIILVFVNMNDVKHGCEPRLLHGLFTPPNVII